MQKQAKWDFSETNLANFGSNIEKEAHYQAGAQEQAWADPTTKVGIEAGLWVWRIEKFTVKAWPKNKYGEFYSGDSYIVLHSYKKNKDTEALAHDIHFWLGLDSSQDEIGTAAYKTVQDNESTLFITYFPHFRVEEGGISSGFNHHSPKEYRHRLLKIKLIKRTVVIREVPKDYTSLNSGDVFVLDTGVILYQLNGKKSHGVEKVKAAEFVQAVERDKEMPKFWEALGSSGPIKPASEDKDSDIANIPKKLFRVSDSSGSLTFTEESVFIWIGLKSTVKEKKYSLQYAQEYIKKFNRPEHTPITRVMEGGENDVFLKSFEEKTI
ncbi:4001_t:CDS:10 [Diversispora eburnea]|uniref:4001_t:CDS:1 n=1 Tax=Diversispora eburnea TaxID=1213867 RepID=A0A9N9G0L7_9GLOM|nr:4001_t:CDS:10 [Diversispora eburnea]